MNFLKFMSEKPLKKIRHQGWNYGGNNWKLSRSKIDLFVNCPRCFYLDNKLGCSRTGFPAFLLNSAVDALLKKEFDIHRTKAEAHPLMTTYGIDAIPFEHPELDTWRENFEGIQVIHGPTGLRISGAIDDVWINPKGELHVVDYKSTSKEDEINLDDKWKEGYKRQMEVYQWLLRQKGFDVSPKGFFVYANGMTDRKAFDGKLEFDVIIIPYEGDDSWVSDTISMIHETLEQDNIPEPNMDCEYCQYFYRRDELEK